ncbi:MAG: hypothetical protein MZV63_65115 [Marinilabiliales bacterium]|nr:hypothetical protein [Marinilabiliales bacterium]
MPKVEVQAVNLYHEIKVGDTIAMDVTIRNTGTRETQQHPGLLRPAAQLAGRDRARPHRHARAEQGRGRQDQVPAARRRLGRRLRAQDPDRRPGRQPPGRVRGQDRPHPHHLEGQRRSGSGRWSSSSSGSWSASSSSASS